MVSDSECRISDALSLINATDRGGRGLLTLVAALRHLHSRRQVVNAASHVMKST